jgi:hypothetical protein
MTVCRLRSQRAGNSATGFRSGRGRPTLSQVGIELAEEFFGKIVAPHAEFLGTEGCRHFLVMNRRSEFLRELLHRVRPSF